MIATVLRNFWRKCFPSKKVVLWHTHTFDEGVTVCNGEALKINYQVRPDEVVTLGTKVIKLEPCGVCKDMIDADDLELCRGCEVVYCPDCGDYCHNPDDEPDGDYFCVGCQDA